MLEPDILRIINRGKKEFLDRLPLLKLWEELALNFYPQRANFINKITLGQDCMAHLTTSTPVLIMRTLQTTVPAIIRPRNKDWFKVVTSDHDELDYDARLWLDTAQQRLKYFLYRRDSGYVRAASEAGSDFMCFGNSVKYISENRNSDGLLFKACHLKDVCWFEDANGFIYEIHNQAKFNAANAIEDFGKDRVHKKILESFEKGDNKTFTFHHIMIKAEYFSRLDAKYGKKFPWVSLWVDVDNEHIIEEVGSYTQRYVISRWQTVSGFQYGYSLATQIALPDARTLQEMALTSLEAAQKAVDPPVVATDDAVRSDVNLFAGGITIVDRDYDERLGQALRPMTVDKSGLNHGLKMMEMIQASLADGLYENKISLPPVGPNMTATEVMQRVQEYARNAIPLFAPLEEEDNAVTIENAFDILMRNNAFGYPEDMPESLSNKDVSFKFSSPIQDSQSELYKQQYMEGLNMATATMNVSPDAAAAFDIPAAFSDVMKKSEMPTQWQKDEDELKQILEEKQQQQKIAEASQILQNAGAGANVAQQVMNNA